MTTCFPRLIARAALLVALVAPAALVSAQIPSGSSARAIPNEVEKADTRVLQVISKAEVHFKQGELNLKDNKRYEAREEFDRAVDVILESGIDVRASSRLQTYYLELVERIYRLEVPNQQYVQPVPQGGMRSEEHTSELQSPYVISYAVFCLKKNKYYHVMLRRLGQLQHSL